MSPPLAGSISASQRMRLSHSELQSARRRGTGALHAAQTGKFLPVKSEELRSSEIQLNELCLTSLLVFYSLLLFLPLTPLFVSSAWECQLPLVEDAAYTDTFPLPFFPLLSHKCSQGLWSKFMAIVCKDLPLKITNDIIGERSQTVVVHMQGGNHT